MTIRDIETIMDDIKQVITGSIQSVITSINTEKGDTLIPTFDPDSYLMHDISHYSILPPYSVFHLQTIHNATDIKPNEETNGLEYRIELASFISQQLNADNDYRIGLRYQRVLYELYSQYIAPHTRGTELLGNTITSLADDRNKAYTFSSLTFKVSVIY